MSAPSRRALLIGAATWLAALAAGCGTKPDPAVVFGSWQAEHVWVGSVGLPIGPQIEIRPGELVVGSGDLRVPIQHMSREGDAVELGLPLNVKLALLVEGNDRLHVEVPLVGTVSYRRQTAVTVSQSSGVRPSQAARDTAPVVPAKVEAAPAVPPAPAAPMAAAATTSPQTLLVERAAEKADAGDPDAAFQFLVAALQAGFRDKVRLEQDQRFDALTTDPRWPAMISRLK